MALAMLAAAAATTSCSGRTADLGRSGAPGSPSSSAAWYAKKAPVKSVAEQEAIPIVEIPENIESFGIDGDQLYWVSTQQGSGTWALNRCNLANCAATVRSLVSGTSNGWSLGGGLESILFDDTFVYFHSSSAEFRHNVLRCSKDGCVAPEGIDVGTDAHGFVMREGWLYWISQSIRIGRCQALNCAATRVETELVSPAGVAAVEYLGLSSLCLHGDAVYVHEYGGRRILKAPIDGSVPFEVIARDEPRLADLAVDNESIYWSEGVSYGSVKVCPKQGCGIAPRSLLSNLNDAAMIVVDETSLYVIEPAEWAPNDTVRPGTGRVARYAKDSGERLRVIAEDRCIKSRVVLASEFAYFLECAQCFFFDASHCVISAVAR